MKEEFSERGIQGLESNNEIFKIMEGSHLRVRIQFYLLL